MLLSGQDMDHTTTPLESGLSWTVAFEPNERKFIGRASLEVQKSQGVKRKMVGLMLPPKQGILRPGQIVSNAHGEMGVITSGGFSPTCQCSIALARVPKSFGNTCEVEIRNKKIEAAVVAPRFVKHGKILI
jgi:glycine cleavage system T protein (aminomethyltransferase)